MTEEQIIEILEERGLDNILEENHMELPFLLQILDELGYLDLERYLEDDNT